MMMPPPDTAVEISFLSHDNPAYLTAFKAAFDAYHEGHASVTFKPTNITYQALTDRLLADLKSDKLAVDLVIIPPSWVCSFAANLSDVPAEVTTLGDAHNNFFAAPLSGSTCGSTLKGLPLEYNLEYGGVVVNMDKFQAMHPGMQPSWATWGDFIADAHALAEFDGTTPKANGLDIDTGWPQPVKHILLSQILQRGGTYWAADGTFDFQSDAAKASFHEMVSWIKDQKVMSPAALVPAANTFVTTRLALGDSGSGWKDPAKPLSVMGYVGTWGLTDTKGQVDAAIAAKTLPAGTNPRYDFVTLPPMVGSTHKFVQNSGWAIVVPKSSKNQKVAWDIAKSIALSPERMRQWSATTGALPALKVNGTPAAAAADPMLAKVQPLLEKGQWVGYIPAGAIGTVEGAMASNFFAAVKNEGEMGYKTEAQALADMQSAANQALAANK
jgi:multiple sugar transport system substrate-binding protein